MVCNSAAFFDHERISEKISFNVNSCISDAVGIGIGIDRPECFAVNAMLSRYSVVYFRIRLGLSINVSLTVLKVLFVFDLISWILPSLIDFKACLVAPCTSKE